MERSRRECKEMAKAAWPMVCIPKCEGGLGVLNIQTQNEALLLKHLDKFFNKRDLPWVKLIWDKHYRNDKLPNSTTPRGSFWWRDILKLLEKFKGMASVLVANGKTCLFWDDVWNSQVRRIQYPELHSFAKNKRTSLSIVCEAEALRDLFHLPLSVEAYHQMKELQAKLSGLVIETEDDRWKFIWGSSQFSSSKAYKVLTGHSQVDPIYNGSGRLHARANTKYFFGQS